MFSSTIKSRENEDISILVKVDNHSFNYICECGDASELTVKECMDTQAIFISHTHIDHFVNFDFILRHQLGIQRKVIICGPKGITTQVQARIRSYQWNLIAENAIIYEIREIISEDQIFISELKPPLWEIAKLGKLKDKQVYRNEKFSVYFTILDHKTPCIAYLFKEEDAVNINLANSGFKGGPWIKALKEAYLSDNPNQILHVGDQSYQASDLFHLLSLKEGDSLGVVMDHAANPENHQKIKQLFSACNKVYIESFTKQKIVNLLS